MSDIIDEIDALVDEQLSGYSDRSGYDYNVNLQTCWHCGREWHGLQITTRMEGMRRVRWYDENYRHAEDDSQILCPGSHFIGPWATRSQLPNTRTPQERALPRPSTTPPMWAVDAGRQRRTRTNSRRRHR